MHLMVKEDINHAVEKKEKSVQSILPVDRHRVHVRIKVKVKLGEKQNNFAS
jgi:hypothetical protein